MRAELATALAHSISPDWVVRIAAAHELAAIIEVPAARSKLAEMLGDAGDIAVQVEAAEALVRHGGAAGLVTVLTELGRRSDDPQCDYLAYRIAELQQSGDVRVLDLVSAVDRAELSAEAGIALRDLLVLIGG
ncbi:HEAT repeat domain-containing protein [Nocardia sp. NPDC056100]|uniref:HEAT repeat domain-containing protein n=1 Tax=Nocardia sp. NPDC056100 TaxID=3345712 RepID=UPI0035E37D4D